MYGRKTKKQPEQGRARQSRPDTQRPASPAFSYYANRPPETTVRRPVERSVENVGKQTQRPKQTRSIVARAPYWLLAVVIVVCVGKLLLLSSSPKIVVLGNSAATSAYSQTSDTYAAAAHKIFSASLTDHTKLTANPVGAAQALQRQFPELQNVSVALPLTGNRPLVYVEVTQPSLVLQSNGSNYAVNSNGLVLAKLIRLPAGVPTLTDQSTNRPVVVGKQFLPGSTVTFITQFDYQLKAAHIGVATYVLPPANPYELDARLSDHAYIVKANLQQAGTSQAGAAVATINQLGTTAIGYIDVRVPGRAYYK